jgi:hypothetical protein
MLAALAVRLKTPLTPTAIQLPEGGHVEVDGVDAEGRVYVEAFAHQGPLKGGQIRKVIMDAFKLAFLIRTRPDAQMILLFSDPAACSPFTSKRWFAQAFRELGLQVEVVDLPEEMKLRLVAAQKRQYR